MENYILGGILLLILGVAIFALFRAKKQGKRCIGCPYASSCGDKCGCQGKHADNEKQK